MIETQNGQNWWWTGATDINREGEWYWSNSLLPLEGFMKNLDDQGISQNYQVLAYNYFPYDYLTDSAEPYFICQFHIDYETPSTASIYEFQNS